MVSFTPASTRPVLDRGRAAARPTAQHLRRLCRLLLVLAALTIWPARAAYEPDIVQMSLQRSSEALQLSARLQVQPGDAVEDALHKGVPLFFVWQADVYRKRWYWSDKRVASANRTLRLVYQPLTRRWRLSLADGTGSTGAGLRFALHQNFDRLSDALAAVGRVSRWRIADAERLDEDRKYRVEWHFSLDLTLLPRPFQIGMANQPQWHIGVHKVLPVPTQIEPQDQQGGTADTTATQALDESPLPVPAR